MKLLMSNQWFKGVKFGGCLAHRQRQGDKGRFRLLCRQDTMSCKHGFLLVEVFDLQIMGPGILDQRALAGIGNSNVLQPVLLMLGSLRLGHCVVPRLLKNWGFADHHSG